MLDFYERFKAHRVTFDMVVTHGNAVGVYFFDPEGNRCEVYWPTGFTVRQPFLEALDLTQPPSAILARIEDLVARYGTTGYVDRSMLHEQNIK